MIAELKKGSHYIVFVLGNAFGVADDDVRVYTYEGHRRISKETYGISFARHYWKMLVTQGYQVVPEAKVPQIQT